jgi:UDP-GlcNAc:undecaprenyl-phosphate GlcNAc-1-phosphate transferase
VLLALGVAAGVSAAATPMVARMARAFQVVDRPDARKVNRRPDIPLLGGLSVAMGFFVGLSVVVLLAGDRLDFSPHMGAMLVGGLLLLALGAWDDRFSLGAWPKFGIQIGVGLLAISYGFQIAHFTNPITQTHWELPVWVMVPATLLWIVGIINAMNLIDGLDGLCAGVATIIAATLAVVCFQGQQPLGVYFGAALVGALLGFLPFNFSPARIFLGDTGAYFIGFALALLALESYRQLSLLTFLVPLLALAVPLLDVSVSVLRRLRRRSNPFQADRAHMHHRLLQFQGSQRQAVLSLYFLTGCFCVIALSFTNLQGSVAIIVVAVVILLTARLLRNLGLFEEGDEGQDAQDTHAKEPR